jgi:hypothetical protein
LAVVFEVAEPVGLPADGLHLVVESLRDPVGASEAPHAGDLFGPGVKIPRTVKPITPALVAGSFKVAKVRREFLPGIIARGRNFPSEAELAKLPGVRTLPIATDIVPGSTADVYAFTRVTLQRNLYRIPRTIKQHT